MAEATSGTRLSLALLLGLLIICSTRVQGIYLDRCSSALGMSSGDIRDQHISASSHYDAAVHAYYGRVRNEDGGGAWCPLESVYDKGTEFLEVNLVTEHLITKLEVQGRFGNGQGKEFAQHYKLQYFRPSIDKWATYKDGHGNEILEGNTNTYQEQMSVLSPPVVASRVRFIPFSDHHRTVCMRVEIYGCLYKEGLVSYSLEEGELKGRDSGLKDVTYDGDRRGIHLSGGLGQLTDGETGHTNYRVDVRGKTTGYEWIGWKNISRDTKPVEITFYFDEIKNFSLVHIFANNFFSKDVQAFSRANILFSVDGGDHFYKGIEFDNKPEKIFETARNVTIRLHESSADTVRLQLFFAMKWIMISEVDFDSVPCKCNFSGRLPTAPTFHQENMYADQTPVPMPSGGEEDFTHVIIVVIGIVGAICMVSVVIGVVYYKARIAKKAITPPSSSDGVITRKFSIKMNDVHVNMNVSKQESGDSIAKGRLYGDVALEEEVAAMYQYREPYKASSQASTYFTSGHSSQFELPLKSIPVTGDSVDYAVPDVTMTPPPTFSEVCSGAPPIPLSKPPSFLSISMKDGTPPPPPMIPSVPPPDQQYYAAPRLCQVTDIRSISGTVLYMNETCYIKREKSIPNIPSGIYNVIEIIGEGEFGTIQLCKIKDNVSLKCKNITPGALCLVKKLKSNVDEEIIRNFKEEATILSKLDDPNITQLLGIANVYDCHTMLIEYSEHGDLYNFLRQHTISSSSHQARNKPTITVSDLIYIATQISSAMTFFETHRFIHRDLATRNCLVGDNLTIKVTDVAMSRPMFREHYYKPDGGRGVMLPIRWMSWESVLEGQFSNKSDVWSFGVTLWELFTLGTSHPYGGLSDNYVLDNLSHCYHNDGSGMNLLQRPSSCSTDVYQIMKKCWRKIEDQRPSFAELHYFLQRKDVGPIR